MLWAQLATKNYIRAEHKLHCISKLFINFTSHTTSHGIHTDESAAKSENKLKIHQLHFDEDKFES